MDAKGSRKMKTMMVKSYVELTVPAEERHLKVAREAAEWLTTDKSAVTVEVPPGEPKMVVTTFPTQPAAIHFVAYDYVKQFDDVPKGSIVPLGVIEEHCTTVYKVQEAFSAVSLPEGNVYGNAIKKCLYGE